MADKIDDGGAAFPNPGTSDSELYASYGMSIRDWFAGQALVGAISTVSGPGFCEWTYYSEAAYRIADAMLAQRTKGPSDEA